jgi:hypothetical protein
MRHTLALPIDSERSSLPRLSWRWLVCAFLVFVSYLFLHLPITDVLDAVAGRLGFRIYEAAMQAGFAVMGVGALVVVGVRRSPSWRIAGAAGAALVACAVLIQQSLLVASIENIHYPQYALLAVLLGRAGVAAEASWLAATGLGVIDELYQYLFLPRGRPTYLDWNDMVLNGLGAAFGTVALFRSRRRFRGDRVCGTAVAIAVAGGAFLVALLVGFPVLSPFFQITRHGRRYHVLSVAEGVAVIALLWLGVRYAVGRAERALLAVPPRSAGGGSGGRA